MSHRIGHDDICQSVCPACGFQIAAPFFSGGAQPLATLAWPASAESARAMPRLPVDFVRCVECGHVYNPAFDVTPARLVTGLITERGVAEASPQGLQALFPERP